MKRLTRLAPRDWIGITLVFAGFVLRLRQYFSGRSLWLDEAMLANNILSRTFTGLFQPLSDNQGAPVGFLLLQKTITLILGNSEYALRLLPFVAGILSLAAMFALMRKITSPFVGTLALALFAFSPALVYYASEVKQYSSDVAIALGLCLLYLKYEQAEINPKDAVLLALAGTFAVWVSHPALFVLGGIGLALFLLSVREKNSHRMITLLLIAAAWSLSLGALYFVNLRQLASHQFFQDFWREGFLPRALPDALAWLGYSLYAPFADLLGLRTQYVFTAFLFLIGLVGLTRRLPRLGLALALIFILALFASFLTLYPFAGRMVLFLAPALILLLADGTEAVAALFARPAWLAWTVRLALTGYLLFGPLTIAAENFTAPKTREHIRPTMEYLRDFRKDGDLVYIYYWAEHAVHYYAPKYGFEMSDFIIGTDHHDQPEAYRAELDSLRGNSRVWFLFSHVYEDGDFNERDYILGYLDSVGKLLREYRVPGTSIYLYLYDLKSLP
jgi:uncharacterized membrane protein